jgi:Icc-related predicted phosphoesterase
MSLRRRLLGGATAEEQLRLFFATDVHGSTLTFRKALSAPRFYGTGALVLGGDLSGKRIVRVNRDDALDEGLVERSEREGFYLWRADADEAAAVEADPAAARELFAGLACERVRAWLQRAEEVLGQTETPCVVIGGNDDPPEVVDVLAAHPGPSVTFAEGHCLPLPGGYHVSGYGWSNPTPWKTPRETDEETIARDLGALLDHGAAPERLIVDVHVPPRGLVDVCTLLDTSVDPPRPIITGSQVATGSVGSTAVRGVLEETQPLLALCGHVHEAHGSGRLGRTLVVNPGSEYGDGVLRGALLTLAGDTVAQYQLTSG